MSKYVKTAKKIIAENLYMTIATATKEGKPWVSPMFFVYDEEYNLYWRSYIKSLHSQLISKNSDVAIVIFDSKAPVGDGDGVYFIAKAEEVENENEIEKVVRLFNNRLTNDVFKLKSMDEVKGKSVKRFYKATPYKVYGLAEGKYINGHYVDNRIEIDLLARN